jgi:anti-sigma factor RsiW
MNKMEERLWNYIDGTCSEDERKAIDILLAQDEAYQRKFEELLNLNQQFSAMELDEPSMAFTYKVMEGIRAEHAQQPLKAVIDKRIIKGIAAFFIFTILALVGYVLSSINFSTVSFSGHLPEGLKMPDLKGFFSGPIFKGFLFFDAVLVLFLFDAYLRKRKVSKQV